MSSDGFWKNSTRYDDIIHLAHPVSKNHPQMTREERAAQFSPFAALSGYSDAVEQATQRSREQVLERENG